MTSTSWVRSPLFNFVGGVLAGACLALSAAVHLITVRVEAMNRAATAANEERIRQMEETWTRKLDEADARLDSCAGELQRVTLSTRHDRAPGK